ncbi:MAG: hydroxyethylthiazole kinase [Lachnospira sp.]|nr:hydroxyethylthiazole kinase [Lachnospira sp.]
MYRPVLRELREQKPMIHCITNSVTARDCANILLGIGGSAIMAEAVEEVEEITSLCNGLVLNLGMLTSQKLSAMLLAGKRANELGIPVVLDPVGVGASSFRKQAVQELLEKVSFTAIRGNLSEIKVLADGHAKSHGVEVAAEDVLRPHHNEVVFAMCKELSRRYHAIVIVSGEQDIVADGEDICLVHNGHAMMSRITGAGCQLSALLGAFLAVKSEEEWQGRPFGFYNSLKAVCTMGVCGELAYESLAAGEGNASFSTRLIDMVYHITDETLLERERYEHY